MLTLFPGGETRMLTSGSQGTHGTNWSGWPRIGSCGGVLLAAKFQEGRWTYIKC